MCADPSSLSAGVEWLLVCAPASVAAAGLRAAPWTAGGAARGLPRPPPPSPFPCLSSVFTFRTPGSLPGGAPLPLYLSARRRGGGPLSPSSAVPGRGGALPRPPPPARVPGARASPGQDRAGSLEAPPTALAPGRGSRAALFRARPPASQARPTNPFSSRCLCAPNQRVALGTPAGLSPAATLGWGWGGGLLLESKLN